jgi:hypothetical protein
MAKSVPSAAVITPADVAPRTGIPKTALSTHTGPAQSVQHFLAAAANWLSTLPANPITDVLQGALWAIRRTLFPASVGVITAPIKVPLYLTNTSTDSGAPKLGIYVSLGYGGTPQLFEFDTGAAGFYAAAASADPSASPWWGSGVTTTSQTVTDKFDSGLVYTGYAATGTVSLFASAGSTTPLVTTATATVGQIDNIDRVPPQGGDEVALWTPDGAVNGVPPIDGAFYGDFGMAPTYQGDGIANLINQLTFARGVTPGFRIHTDPSTGESWMQIGLTAADLQEPTGMFFAMVADPKAPQGATAPHSGVGYYSLQLIQATITIVNKAGTTVVSDANVGITPDTGASTTLHNTDNSPSSKEYDDKLIEWKNTDDTVGRIRSDHTFSLSGTTSGGSAVTFFDFPTTDVVDAGKIDVQNDSEKKDTYYLNTGISLFYDYDVVYAMGTSQGGGTLGLIPRSPQAL